MNMLTKFQVEILTRTRPRRRKLGAEYFCRVLYVAGLCSTQIFRADSTLTHVTIQAIQL